MGTPLRELGIFKLLKSWKLFKDLSREDFVKLIGGYFKDLKQAVVKVPSREIYESFQDQGVYSVLARLSGATENPIVIFKQTFENAMEGKRIELRSISNVERLKTACLVMCGTVLALAQQNAASALPTFKE